LKSPKGFAKRYFTFSSILAHSVAKKLHSQVFKVQSLLFAKLLLSDEKEENEEILTELLVFESINLIQSKQSSCHCNCYFNLKTRLATRIYHYIPRCPYYNPFFAFRRTGVHPPPLVFFKSF